VALAAWAAGVPGATAAAAAPPPPSLSRYVVDSPVPGWLAESPGAAASTAAQLARGESSAVGENVVAADGVWVAPEKGAHEAIDIVLFEFPSGLADPGATVQQEIQRACSASHGVASTSPDSAVPQSEEAHCAGTGAALLTTTVIVWVEANVLAAVEGLGSVPPSTVEGAAAAQYARLPPAGVDTGSLSGVIAEAGVAGMVMVVLGLAVVTVFLLRRRRNVEAASRSSLGSLGLVPAGALVPRPAATATAALAREGGAPPSATVTAVVRRGTEPGGAGGARAADGSAGLPAFVPRVRPAAAPIGGRVLPSADPAAPAERARPAATALPAGLAAVTEPPGARAPVTRWAAEGAPAGSPPVTRWAAEPPVDAEPALGGVGGGEPTGWADARGSTVAGGPVPAGTAAPGTHPQPGWASGWYAIDGNPYEQAYYDGTGWISHKRWDGAAWVDIA
jgi:hypothetical protein